MRPRITITRLGLAMLCTLPLTVLGGGPAQAATRITTLPFTTSSVPHEKHFILAEDLFFPGALCPGGQPVPAITIDTPDAHLNMAGFSLTGPRDHLDACLCDDPQFIGIAVMASGVHIHGGTVTNFDGGIRLLGVTRTHLNDLTLEENCFWGVDLSNADANRLNRNDISRNFGGGVRVFGSDSNRFTANTLRENLGGYNLTDSSDNVITSNDISHNTGNTGVFIERGGSNIVRGNTINNSGTIAAIELRVTTVNLIRGNTISGNVGSGVRILPDATENTVRSNTALDNGRVDLEDLNLPACRNTWRRNLFATDNEGDGPGAGCIQ